MRLEGAFSFQAPPHMVWDVLMDIDAIAAALGIPQIHRVMGRNHTWRATVQFDWLFIHSHASYLIWLSDIDAPNRYCINVQGEGHRSSLAAQASSAYRPWA